MRRARKATLPVLLGISVFLSSALEAKAEFLAPFQGNTFMHNLTSTVDGTVSFAVWHNGTQADWTTDGGLGLPAGSVSGFGSVDKTAKFVFFYEVSHATGTTGTDPITSLRVFRNGINYSSAGKLTNTIFKEDTGATPDVGPSGNPGLGPDLLVPGVPNIYGGTPKFEGTDTSATTAIAPDAFNPNISGYGVFFFLSTIPSGSWSTVMFLTSNIDPGPAYGDGRVTDGGFSNGPVPIQNPAPSSWLLAVMGVIGLGGCHAWRRGRRVVSINA